jgi:CopA family copper-resistance protein
MVIFALFISQAAQAGTVEYNLTIARQALDITGAPAMGMTINGHIPGPVLRFTEGDTALIHVRNNMEVSTSIHWHGILLPPGMDGVPNISFPPIEPGQTFTYTFPIRQSGTYWYHSHTNLQEQSGVYGAIVIQPRQAHKMAGREHVVVLSDWTDEDPHQVLRNLKRGSEYFAVQKGSGQSIFGAIKAGQLGDYFQRELMRMPPMDISDVAYDRFLANGQPQISLEAKGGETIRMRVVDGSATTFFYLQFAGGPMTIVSADGIEVEPVQIKRLLIGVAETYDLLLKMPPQGSYELRTTAHDGSSHASVWLGKGPRHAAPQVPRPNLYNVMGGLSFAKVMAFNPGASMGMPDHMVEKGAFDSPGMHGMGDMGGMHDMGGMQSMEGMKPGQTMSHGNAQTGMSHGQPTPKPQGHAMQMPASQMATPPAKHKAGQGDHVAQGGAMKMRMNEAPPPPPSGKRFAYEFAPLATDVASSPSLARDGMAPQRPPAPYDRLRNKHSTAFDPKKPRRIIRLTLDGDMERYVWLLNNKALSAQDDIVIKQGEVARFIMINRTMMYHPMHLHGHFFRVINKQGDHAPLKHTVIVEPMSTTVIEFKANEVGDWFFHCHLLYHMKAGMARLVHYEEFTPPPAVQAIRPNLYKESWYFQFNADILSNMIEGFVQLSNTRHILMADWEVGWQDVEETEWESVITWDYYLDRFKSVFIGAFNEGYNSELEKTRGVVGLRYLLPLNFESRTWIDTDGGFRITLDKEFMLTPRLALFGEAQYDTHDLWEGEVGLSYMINGHVSLVGKWHSEYGWGGGLNISF